eukprot:COSAG02_NODE_5819_length_4016_cov_1.859586_5_plen_54_part_00
MWWATSDRLESLRILRATLLDLVLFALRCEVDTTVPCDLGPSVPRWGEFGFVN